jgi:glycosyltransferase involved in cell wall biosynthesis
MPGRWRLAARIAVPSQSLVTALEVSVVIPAYNEEGNVGPLTAEVHAALAGVVEYEVVWVDDGSSDATVEKLREIAQATPGRVRIIRHPHSCGQSTALASGIAEAHGEWIATLDGDMQNDPADIPAMLVRRTDPEPADMICGHRTTRKDTWLKRVSSKVANRVRGGLLRDRTPDTGCGLKVFRRDLFLALPYFDHMHRFLPALALRDGATVVSVPVNHRPRETGSSKYGLWDRLWVGVVDMFGVRWLIKRERRPASRHEEEI